MKQLWASAHIYDAHRDAMVRYAAGLLRDHARAEDVVHDAWLLLDQHPEKAAVRDPVSYLHRIVRNLSLNILRRRLSVESVIETDIDDVGDIADPAPSAEDQAIAAQKLERFMRRLADLPERHRIAIRMHRLEDRKLREIAEHFGMSVAVVHRWIADGLVRCADPPDKDGL